MRTYPGDGPHGVARQARGLLRAAPLTAAYLAVLAAGSVWLAHADPATRSAVLQEASSNLANLGAGRLDVLLTSAVVVVPPAGPALLLGAPLLAAGEAVRGSRRAAAVFLFGHTAATLAVLALLQGGTLPGVHPAAVRSALDVGLSYGVLAVVGALVTARLGHPWSWAAVAVGVLAVPLLLAPPTFTAWGHLFGVLAGTGAGAVLRRRIRVAP